MSVVCQSLTLLGATGSIGGSTLDIIARHPSRYRLYAVSAYSQVDRLIEICQQFKPVYAVLGDESQLEECQNRLKDLGVSTKLLFGAKALEQIASDEQVDTVVAAIVGAAGLPSALAAAQAGKKILLANKESLVMAGALFMDAVKRHNAILLPIDSEHNAIFQCLPIQPVSQSVASACDKEGSFSLSVNKQQVHKILLTASGGPFREFDAEALESVTVAQAVAHPNWSMGRKISVDSASLMNKGLELIEACWLFDVSPSDIEVVVHKQSIIHSMVQYVDGTTLAQMGNPDMRTPITQALSWPERIDAGVAPLNLFDIARLDFEPADTQRFPNLRLAAEAFSLGGAACAVLNAVNEVMVDAFLNERIGFADIARFNEQVLYQFKDGETYSLHFSTVDELLAVDAKARDAAKQLLRSQSQTSQDVSEC